MKHRSTEKELMDLGPAFYTEQEYAECLNLLFKVNCMLGFFRQTVKWLKHCPPNASLVDVGCGGGLSLLHLSKRYPQMRFLGIDVSKTAIERAQAALKQWKQTNPAIAVDFQLQAQLKLDLAEQSSDLVLITLVCHHVDDADLVVFLQTAYRAARVAVLINDLHRHPVAYGFYKAVSPWLFRNRLITHDGLVSIKRSFTRNEWHALFKRAGIESYEIKWCFPFRWRVVLWKK